MALMWNRTVDWDTDDWRRSAACRNTEPDLFFPVGTTGPAIDQIEAAKRVCRSCEAITPCLEFALATNQESGVWGGTSEEERRKLRKAWLAARRSRRTCRLLSSCRARLSEVGTHAESSCFPAVSMSLPRFVPRMSEHCSR